MAAASSPPASPPAAPPPRPAGSPLVFLLLTFAASWACYVPVAAFRSAGDPLGRALVLAGTFMPSLVALALTWRGAGERGVLALLGRLFQGRVAARWYLFALLYTAAVKLTVAVLHRVATGAWPRFGDLPWLLIPVAILFSTPFQAGEEIGWRGYALPRLAARWGLAGASLALGVIWALWHLPLFFVRGADTHGQSFPLYTLQVVAISVAIAWLWARAGYRLLPVMLLHAAVNNSKDIVPSANPGAANVFGLDATLVGWLSAAVFGACALGFLAWMARTERGRAGRYPA